MIPPYYDKQDAENFKAIYAVEAGRMITKNGVPFVYIQQCEEPTKRESACVADYFTYALVDILNLYLMEANKRAVLRTLGKQ